jgi:hypothetical protein
MEGAGPLTARSACRKVDAETPLHPNGYRPGDAVRLRGLPAVCVRGGFGGAIRGTDPLRELLRRERRG